MASDAAFASYCAELLSSAGEVRWRRMFGGYGMYVEDAFVAIIASETLYLKADEQTQGRFESAGCVRFAYTARGKTHALGFWTVPPEAMDSAGAMRPWATLALDAARRASRAKARRKAG